MQAPQQNRTSRTRSVCVATLTAAMCLTSSGETMAQRSATVFAGRPAVKISEGGTERIPEVIAPVQAANLECVISKIEGKYYWASRRNTPLIDIDSGAFITYVAVNGSGYVRILKSDSKVAASAMSTTEAKYDYVEHALIGLRSVTYYGTRQP